jgi:hypothetical protein
MFGKSPHFLLPIRNRLNSNDQFDPEIDCHFVSYFASRIIIIAITMPFLFSKHQFPSTQSSYKLSSSSWLPLLLFLLSSFLFFSVFDLRTSASICCCFLLLLLLLLFPSLLMWLLQHK